MITVYGLNKLGFTNIDDFNLQDDGDGVYIKKWNSDQSQPSEADITTAHNAWQIEYDAQEYARNRKEDYPSTGDQWDMIYKDNKNSTTTHADAVEAVKTKWPKNNTGPVE